MSFPYLTDLGYDKNIAAVDKLDDYTVRFTLKTPDVVFVRNIAMEFASILPAANWWATRHTVANI